MSLKVSAHPRGHVAACNGSLHQVDTIVKCDLQDRNLNAAERAALVQEWTEKERVRRALKLVRFQEEVKSRVNAMGKVRRREMAQTCSKAMISEQNAAERAQKLSDTKVRQYVAKSCDVEDAKMTTSTRESLYQVPPNISLLQKARTCLLSQSQSYKNEAIASSVMVAASLTPSQKMHGNYQSVTQMSPEKCSRRLLMEKVAEEKQILKSPKHSVMNFIAPGQVEHIERVQAGKQYLVSRRLFSDLEREKARKTKKQKSHSRRVKALKRKKEARRKRIEQEANLMVDSCSIVSTSLSEEKQLATEWAELMMQEEQKQELQKAKEMERYTIALRVQLQELVATRKVEIPPLCSCGETVWDTNPKTCANNCIFYRNPKVYLKAIKNLLQSLNL